MPYDARLEARIIDLIDVGRVDAAAEASVRGYGTEIYGFLVSSLRDRSKADDAFSEWSEDVWKNLAKFRRESSVRTWVYALAHNAAHRLRRTEGRHHKRFVEGGETAAEKIAWEVRSATSPLELTETKDRLREAVNLLDDEDRELVELRLYRKLEWNDIARIVVDADLTGADLKRERDRLAKRYQRSKERLAVLLKEAGLLPT